MVASDESLGTRWVVSIATDGIGRCYELVTCINGRIGSLAIEKSGGLDCSPDVGVDILVYFSSIGIIAGLAGSIIGLDETKSLGLSVELGPGLGNLEVGLSGKETKIDSGYSGNGCKRKDGHG